MIILNDVGDEPGSAKYGPNYLFKLIILHYGGENTVFNDITKKSDSDLFYPRSFVGFGIRYFLPH